MEDVLCYWGEHVPMDVGVYIGNDAWQESTDRGDLFDVEPTHWMPLPPPPSFKKTLT